MNIAALLKRLSSGGRMKRLLTRITTGGPAVSIAGALVFLAPAVAFPCSCLPSGSPCSIVGGAAVVFVGTPVAVVDAATQNGEPSVRVRFRIDEAIQNIDLKTVDVLTASDTAACGFPFETGRKYLVYASGSAGVYSVSLCSRTGLLDARRNDLELLREAAAGSVRPRLFGTIYRLQLQLDGFYLHYDTAGGIADVPVRLADGDRRRETRTDANGDFSIRDVSPGPHVVQPQLPGRYAPLFERENTVTVDTCSGEAGIGVATIPLRGTVQAANGEALVPRVMLRIAQLDSSGGVTFERSTLAFAEADGSWKVPGLPSGRYVLGVSTFDPPSPRTPYPTTWYPDVPRPNAARVFDVTDEGTIAVEFRLPARIPETRFHGRTVAPDGAPLANVALSLYDSDADNTRGSVGYSNSDNEGRFTITGLSGRRYRIQGMQVRSGGGTSAMVDVASDDRRDVIVTITAPK
jgi:hypothetical protein